MQRNGEEKTSKADVSAKEGARRLERGFGVFTRSFKLPDTVDATNVAAR